MITYWNHWTFFWPSGQRSVHSVHLLCPAAVHPLSSAKINTVFIFWAWKIPYLFSGWKIYVFLRQKIPELFSGWKIPELILVREKYRNYFCYRKNTRIIFGLENTGIIRTVPAHLCTSYWHAHVHMCTLTMTRGSPGTSLYRDCPLTTAATRTMNLLEHSWFPLVTGTHVHTCMPFG